jgi:glutathione peroxidase
VPCNQFGGQEPGTSEEIEEFCHVNYGVTFPLTEKIEVNGPGRHPLYELLTRAPDANGEAGDITWNFEKFLVDPAGEVVDRFRPQVVPEAPELLDALDRTLPR